MLCKEGRAAGSPPRCARCLTARYSPRCCVPFLASVRSRLRRLLAAALALLFRPFFYLSPIHIFALQVLFASWALGGASLRFQHSSSIRHLHPASPVTSHPSARPPPPPPHLLNPSFPVLIRCCQPTQRKAGRSTALPKIARDVVYAQWWHLNRRCARVMPGQSS